MQFNGVNNKERNCCSLTSGVSTFKRMCQDSIVLTEHMSFSLRRQSQAFAWFLLPGSFCFPPSLPPLLFPFSTVYQCDGCLSSLEGLGAHGWFARICQPRERSQSRSCLPIVEAMTWQTVIPAMCAVSNCGHYAVWVLWLSVMKTSIHVDRGFNKFFSRPQKLQSRRLMEVRFQL